MLPSIRKFFKSISLCGLFSLFPLLPISAQDIADQHPLPDSIGSKMKYNASIEMKKGYLSGICMLIRDKDGYKGSIFNEFGISVLDFTYQPVTGKVKLENVIQLLDKWYIKRLLKQDLSQVIKNLQKGISIYDNKKYKIHYQFTELKETMEEKENMEDKERMEEKEELKEKEELEEKVDKNKNKQDDATEKSSLYNCRSRQTGKLTAEGRSRLTAEMPRSSFEQKQYFLSSSPQPRAFHLSGSFPWRTCYARSLHSTNRKGIVS